MIVVIAILGILAAIAIPRFSDLRASSSIKADGATAAQIVAAARIQETETGFKVTSIDQTTQPAPSKDAAVLLLKYMTVPTTSQSGKKTAFSISGGGTGNYVITWAKEDTGNYTYTENEPFTP